MVEKQVVKDLILALIYITSWEEEAYDKTYYRSWKGYPFSFLDELSEENLISGSHRSKSIYLSDEGVKKAVEIIGKYNLEDGDLNVQKNRKSRKKKINKKNKKSKKNNKTEAWTEEEYDEYMSELYGFEYIAGYTDSGVPYGVSKEQEDHGKQTEHNKREEQREQKEHDKQTFTYDEGEIPF